MQFGYRLQQFLNAITAAPSQKECQEVQSFLAPGLMDLFSAMQPGEQAHSLQIYLSLKGTGVQNPDLLTAALLHDVGKNRLPLRLWERAYIVLANSLAPGLVETWGQASLQEGLPFWKRAFVVAVQHPAWGAQMAEEAGASTLAANLIRNHQVTGPEKHPEIAKHEVELIKQLQTFDNAF